MASDNFMEFKQPAVFFGGSLTVTGESKDKIHPNTFELKTFEFGVENPNTLGSATGGAGAGKAKFAPFKITRGVDIGSAPLFQACAAGCHFPEVWLYIRKAGGGATTSTPLEYLVFKFYTMFVTNIGWSGGEGEDAPTENVEFAYGAMIVNYKKQKADGTLDNTPAIGSWSQILNQQNFTS